MTPYFVVVTAVFITGLITANIVAVKLIDLFGLVVPAAIIIFPVSYICGDVLTEVYGYARARMVIWLGFLCNLLAVAAIWVAQVLPPASFWEAQPAYERILGYTPRLLLASFLGYLVGAFANSVVMARMKVGTRGRWLWARTIASTIVGEGLDTFLFIVVAFYGAMPGPQMMATVVTHWLLKSAYEAAATPLTYAIVRALKRVEGQDVYDVGTNFNPLALFSRGPR